MSIAPEPPAKSASVRPRRAWVAALLTFITPGLGQLYAGRPRRALAMFAVASLWILAAVAWRSGAFPRFWMTVLLYGAWLIMTLFIVVDAVRLAIRAKTFQPTRYNRWYVYIGVWLAGMAVIGVPLAIAKAYAPSGWFDVASSSMEPTLRLGERFLVDPAYYHSHEPSRGDVIVYPLPSDPNTLYLKRIVALPGDRIAIKDGIAVVNGQSVSEPYIRVLDGRVPYNNTVEVTVPAGHVFVLGDNRSISLDSRVRTHGTVPIENLRGRVTEIGFSRDLGRLGLWVGTPR